jgi:nucleoside 2-deoxyribosyltransferase
MKRLFMSYALERDRIPELQERIGLITLGAEAAGYTAYAHVRDTQGWEFEGADLREVLNVAFEKISESDAVLLDLTTHCRSYKRVGLNIEGGYAKALRKPIVAIWRYPDRPLMTADLADLETSYEHVAELEAKTKQLLGRMGS